MGRTKRKRIRKKGTFFTACLDSDPFVIALNQWMKAKSWINENSLKLCNFENTGRGLTSSRNIRKPNRLIEVPYALMISYTTLEQSYLLNEALLPEAQRKLTIQDLLSIYLVMEKHKGNKSKWKTYIESLPTDIPHLPWLCSYEEINKIPQELKTTIQERLLVFESSWNRSKESINPRWKCECCETSGRRVLTLNSFIWAYVMVNTRSVYVDPVIVRGLSQYSGNNFGYFLSDEPCMALCPYLDMFNHSNKAATHAELVYVDGKWFFRLSTLTSTKKYQEIFISYGSHDNVKLFCEYGFFISDFELDVVKLDFSEILNISKISINEKQYKFVRTRHLDCELTVSSGGLSYNLKAVLFIILNAQVIDWCPYVFSEKYSEDHVLQMYKLVNPIIDFKTFRLSNEVSDLSKSSQLKSEYFKNVLGYLKYRLTFLEYICDYIHDQINKDNY